MKIVRLLSVIAASVTVVSSSQAITITEDFSAASSGGSPYVRGWAAVGDTNLFVWNSAAGNLAVTWDSAKPNSFFQQPLGMTLNKTNDFSIAFDFKLLSLVQYPSKPFSFQLAIGFIRLAEATNTNYFRGSGYESPNLAEFTYFADTGFGAGPSPILISTNHDFAYGLYQSFEFVSNELYRVEMSFTGANQTLSTIIKHDGTNVFVDAFSLLGKTNFTDVALDTVSISSYNDGNQFPGYEGSILATAIIDNMVITTPAPAIGRIAFTRNGSANQANVFCQPGETYILQRTSNFTAWTNVTSALAVSSQLTLQDTNSVGTSAFYRILQQP